jgi:hypothetical protein
MFKIERPEGSIRITDEIDLCPYCTSGKPEMVASGAYQCPRCSYGPGSGVNGYTLIVELTLYPMYTEYQDECFSCGRPNESCIAVWRQITWCPPGTVASHREIDRDPNGSDFITHILEGWCCGECGAIAVQERHPFRRISTRQARELLDAGYLPRFPQRAAS